MRGASPSLFIDSPKYYKTHQQETGMSREKDNNNCEPKVSKDRSDGFWSKNIGNMLNSALFIVIIGMLFQTREEFVELKTTLITKFERQEEIMADVDALERADDLLIEKMFELQREVDRVQFELRLKSADDTPENTEEDNG